MNHIWRIFWAWMPLGVAVTGLSILCYASAQQVFRQSINDVPTQLSQDTATVLSHGAVPADVVPKVTVDIRTSLYPFLIIYDKDGKVIAGNGKLDGDIPTPPRGVFANVGFWRTGHSWQAKQHVRIDAAINTWDSGNASGFVLAGRNMRLMEDHVEHVGYLMLQAWIFMMFATFVAKAFSLNIEKYFK